MQKLYTFQKMHVWDNLVELGYYHPFFIYQLDEFLKEEQDKPYWSFNRAYEWLVTQMMKRGISYEHNCSHLIWAWAHWNGSKKKRPDKRFSTVTRFFSDEPFVMMEIELDPKRVMLTDYDAWHSVLNYWYLDKERASRQFEKEWNYFKEKPLSNKLAHERISQSWETIFDLKKSREILQYPQKDQMLQATFFELFYTDIKKVHFFDKGKCLKILDRLNYE